VGLDLVEVDRLRKALARYPRLEERLFTPAEIAYCRGRSRPALHFAARFAAKEAVGKLLGTGVLSWQEIEVTAAPGTAATLPGVSGAPRVRLSGRTARLAAERGIEGIGVSLSHVDSLAGACVMVVAGPLEGADMNDLVGTAGSDFDNNDPGRCRGRAGLLPLEERPAVFTPAQMREMDRATIEDLGVPGPVLMERAALGVTALILDRYPDRHTLVVCGSGNNGGDGLAAARQLHVAGHPVACIVTARSAADLSPDAALNFKAAEKAGVNLRAGEVPDYLWDETEVVVDCLLGTGATGELRGLAAEWAGRINAAAARGVPVVAVDVPSGVDSATGSIASGTVAADVTVTFHAPKSGLVCPPGSEAAGEVLVCDIGIPESLEPEPDLWVVTADDVNIPGRRVDDHKYRAGYVCVLAGSTAYPGAAWLASQAAYRTGAGYVRLLMTAGAADGVRGRLVETVLEEIGPGECLTDAAPVLEVLADERVGALVVGPGLGRALATVEAVRRVVLWSKVPAVLDADGLFAFAGTADLLKARPGLVLTPHIGELAALLGAPVAELAASALAPPPPPAAGPPGAGSAGSSPGTAPPGSGRSC
jgi:NAD(P)H-hydrate epimerase